jgi:Dihaem cytochrome c
MKIMRRFRNSSCYFIVLLFVGCSAEMPLTPVVYPESSSAAAHLYLARCGDCHRAPQPSAYSAPKWTAILQRMQMRMQANARMPLTPAEMKTVSGYVKKYAKVKK